MCMYCISWPMPNSHGRVFVDTFWAFSFRPSCIVGSNLHEPPCECVIVDSHRCSNDRQFSLLCRKRFLSFPEKIVFSEFAEYVVDTWLHGRQLDKHWRPQHTICGNCYIKYDFIGRFENLNEDAEHVLSKLTSSGGPGSNVTFPYTNAYDKSVPLSEHLKEYFADVGPDTVRQLVHIYTNDYKLFGYDYSWACSDCNIWLSIAEYMCAWAWLLAMLKCYQKKKYLQTFRPATVLSAAHIVNREGA